MQIIKYYTGNPMLNNALMTIKALAGLSSISELTTDVLRRLIMKVHVELPYSLMELNKRFKSYTMLFTRNSLLYNGKSGAEIYQRLMIKIVDSFKNGGDNVCDISGLQYDKPFSQLLSEVLRDLGVSEKDIAKKDLTLNRCWFPLLGGLGSDAQALPMAKYTYNIHPIFIVILQFLSLSALMYKKGLLLVDSSNLEISELYIQENVDEVISHAKVISSKSPIENIKKFTKGHSILKALNVMKELKIDFGHSEVNFWSFSNSGTGADCDIDRIPNDLLLKLEVLYIRHKSELTRILCNSMYANSFFESLESNIEWFGLYPNKTYEGVTIEFFESYWEVIGQEVETELAKYIVYLISKYKSDDFKKYLVKRDAYDCKIYNYKDDLNKVLLKATQNGEWSFNYQLYIQDNKDIVPILFASYKLYKLIHFYYQKETYTIELPEVKFRENNQSILCKWIISLISKESEEIQVRIKKCILDNNNIDTSIFDELFIRHADGLNISIYTIFPLLYTDNGRKNIRGLKSLLRYYYTSLEVSSDDILCTLPEITISDDFKKWFQFIDTFVVAYIRYRMVKVVSYNKKGEYLKKIFNGIPKIDVREQRIWFRDILNRLNDFEKEGIWDEDSLVYDPLGNYNFSTFIYVVRMKMSNLIYEYSFKTIDI